MNKLYTNGNYVIAEDSRGVHEYGKAKSVYSVVSNPEGYVIKEAIDVGELVIPTADIGLWYDEAGTTAYTEATLVAFLRANTANFSSGGVSKFSELSDTPSYSGNGLKLLRINGAENAVEVVDNTGPKYRAVIELSTDGESMTNTVLFTNFPDDITVDQLSIGQSLIEFNTNPIPQVMQGMMWNNAGDYWRSFVAVQEGDFLYIQETSLDGDSWGDGDYAESEGLKTVLTLEYWGA